MAAMLTMAAPGIRSRRSSNRRPQFPHLTQSKVFLPVVASPPVVAKDVSLLEETHLHASLMGTPPPPAERQTNSATSIGGGGGNRIRRDRESDFRPRLALARSA